MLYHVRIDTHKFDWVDLYFQQVPTKDDLLKTADSIIIQYENGKPQAKIQYGYNWDWNKSYNQWKRAFKILDAPPQTEYDLLITNWMNLAATNPESLHHEAKLYSKFSNGYYIWFIAFDPLTDVNDPRLSHNLKRIN